MTVKVAINGFGRVGRIVARLAHERDDVEIVAINSRADVHILAHLLKYDSVHGVFKSDVDYKGDSILIDDKPIRVTAETDDLTKFVTVILFVEFTSS